MTIKYSKDHEWIAIEGDIGTVGILQNMPKSNWAN